MREMSIHQLPNELHIKILHSLTSLQDTLKCRLVCRHWNNLLLKFGTHVETLYYNITPDCTKYYHGQNVIKHNKNLRRRDLKFAFGLMPNLKRFGVSGCPPRPIVYDLIGDYFTNLQGLCLADTTLSVESFVRLMGSLPNLKILNFSRRAKDFDAELPTIDISPGLKVAPSLRSIHLSGHFEIDDSFQFLESLEELDIDIIDELHNLSRLDYERLLQNCINLKRLCVCGFFPVMIVFQNHFPKLEYFEWNKKDDANDSEFNQYIHAINSNPNLTKLPNLKTLVIRFFDDVLNCGIADVSEEELMFATCEMQMHLINFLPNLQNLCIDSGCKLETLTQKCPKIVRLQFNGSLAPKLNDTSCQYFGNLKHLKELRVVSQFISANCIRIIVDSCKNLDKLYVDGIFGLTVGKALLFEICQKLRREIIFDEGSIYQDTIWREDWLNQFIDPSPEYSY